MSTDNESEQPQLILADNPSHSRTLPFPMRLSAGDFYDRLLIAKLKLSKLEVDDPRREAYARYVSGSFDTPANQAAEASLLRVLDDEQLDRHKKQQARLYGIHRELWEVEDRLREMEQAQQFGDPFVAAARLVYKLNDERAAIKAEIDRRFGTAVDPKIYRAERSPES